MLACAASDEPWWCSRTAAISYLEDAAWLAEERDYMQYDDDFCNIIIDPRKLAIQ